MLSDVGFCIFLLGDLTVVAFHGIDLWLTALLGALLT